VSEIVAPAFLARTAMPGEAPYGQGHGFTVVRNGTPADNAVKVYWDSTESNAARVAQLLNMAFAEGLVEGAQRRYVALHPDDTSAKGVD
jgi:hypothetical protein